jgi:hypothetical protein
VDQPSHDLLKGNRASGNVIAEGGAGVEMRPRAPATHDATLYTRSCSRRPRGVVLTIPRTIPWVNRIRLDPFAAIGRLRATTLPTPPATFTAVYSGDGANTLYPLVEQAIAAGWQVRLWCLTDPAHELERWTVGTGPGTRGAHLNRLAATAPSEHWLIQCDDDVAMQSRGLRDWIRLAVKLDLDITQPGQGVGSHAAHAIVRRSRRQLARVSTFVEMGPLIAFSPQVRPHVPPLPEHGFGWGSELHLYDLHAQGFRLGIIDAIHMWHLRPAASLYDSAQEYAVMQAMLRERGLRGWDDVQHVIGIRRWV